MVRRKSHSLNENVQQQESSKGELNHAKHQVIGVINSIEETIYKKEEQRDYKMKSKFRFKTDIIIIIK